MYGGHAVHQAVRAYVERRGACTLAAGPLPSNVLDVLKMAARSADKLDLWSLDLNIPPQRLVEIAGAFIEEVLVTPEASHYRVLGVEPDASEARITVHYNWLMQWLRVAGHDSERHVDLALRIKTAYRDLSDPQLRAAYDAAKSQALAARLENAIQPAQYDPRRTPGPAAEGMPPPVALQAAIPVEATPQADGRAAAEDDSWHTETILLEPSDFPSPAPRDCRPDEVIALLSRPAPTPEPPRVRRRAHLALAVFVLAAAIMLWLTRGEWLPWLEGKIAVGGPGPAPAQVDQAPPALAPAGTPETMANGSQPTAVEVADSTVEIPVRPQAWVVAPIELPPEPSGALPEAAVAVEPATAGRAVEPPPAPAVAQVTVVPAVPAVPAEAREAARRVADAYASGDVMAVLGLVKPGANLTQPEVVSIAEEVKHWWFMQPGEPLSITSSRLLPRIPPEDRERAAVELRTSDDAGLRVIVARHGAAWRATDVLVIAPTVSRDGGSQ